MLLSNFEAHTTRIYKHIFTPQIDLLKHTQLEPYFTPRITCSITHNCYGEVPHAVTMPPPSVRDTAKITYRQSDRAIKVLQPTGSHKIKPKSQYNFDDCTRRQKRGITWLALVPFDDDIMTSDTNCLQDCVERDQGKRPIAYVYRPHYGDSVVHNVVDDCHAEEDGYNESIDDIHHRRAADLKT